MVAVVKHRHERKKWTEKQLVYLEDNYGKRDIDEMSKYLGRSVEAIRAKAGRILGSQDVIYAQGLITTKDLAEMLGVDYHAVARWAKDYGLPSEKFKKRKNCNEYKLGIYTDKFWDWLKDHRNKVCVDPNKIKRGQILPEPDWLQEDIVNGVIYGRRKWDKKLENTVWDMYYFNRKTITEISKEIGMSFESVRKKLERMQKKKVEEAKKKRKVS